MTSAIVTARERNSKMMNVFRPEIFRLTVPADKQRFDLLLQSEHIVLFDEIESQIRELIKSRRPASVLSADDYARLIPEHLNGAASDDFGVWVYYPWSGRIVHMLDEQEFIELRTAANKNKITTAEREILAAKKVGVIGLSVGQSVSLTLALERGCGELRLADFDTLELNNLNRIRTGVHNLGLLKAYAVAREIAEIDPFFNVVCFTSGITEENIDDFFNAGGRLDAVIDECDGINIKILCRIKAKEFNVPVLMEASDRGTLDVERFDLHPDRPIMHGWLEHLTLDFNVLRNLKTNEEKVPYMLPISGLDTLSSRMKASMIELRNTLTTWPQLATAVTLGGALTADTCRRIFLGQFTDSGRYFIDLETIVPDTRPRKAFEPEPGPMPVSVSEMNKLAARAFRVLPVAAYVPEPSRIGQLVAAAIKAPSAANAQPWQWLYSGGYLFLFLHNTGILTFSDVRQSSSYASLGAALENLALQAAAEDIGVEIKYLPVDGESRLAAAVSFTASSVDNDLFMPEALVQQIDKRVTDRSNSGTAGVSESVLEQLAQAAGSVPCASISFLQGSLVPEFGNIAGPLERLRILNPASHHEYFTGELRWTAEETEAAEDGVPVDCLAISQPEEIAMKMVRYPEVARLLAEWKGGQALEYAARKYMHPGSTFGLISVRGSDPSEFMAGGRAIQRMWLAATQHGLAIHPVNLPLAFFNHLSAGGSAIQPSLLPELEELAGRFEHLFPGNGDLYKLFLFRIFLSGNAAKRTPRKPLDSVLVFA